MYEFFLSRRAKKGFTLVEMLIVVAIIAILVAIAIPVFSAQLEKARQAVDNGNLRSAESLAVAAAMLGEDSAGTAVTFDATTKNAVFYATVNADTHALDIVFTSTAPNTGYNEATQGTIAPKGAVIIVTVNDTFEIVTGATNTGWVAKG